jgi:hypothetical protein
MLANKFVRSCMVWYSSQPLGLIKREPQYWRFSLKSPPTRNLCPGELMNSLSRSFNYVAWGAVLVDG